MSCVVCVRQFLRSGAAREFDEAFRLHRELVSQREGFVSLRRLTPSGAQAQQNGLVAVVLLEFQNEAQLLAWRESDEHKVVANKYRSLWLREPLTEFFNMTTE